MKAELLSYIQPNNLYKVEALINRVLEFYNSLELSFDNLMFSEFVRDVDFSTSPYKAKGRIIISTSDNFETALVHELLHLAIPLKHNTYSLYFPTKCDAEFVSMIQNVIEHDLMIDDFLELGYKRKQFFKNSYNPIDYKKERLLKEPSPYWLFEYFRLTFSLSVGSPYFSATLN